MACPCAENAGETAAKARAASTAATRKDLPQFTSRCFLSCTCCFLRFNVYCPHLPKVPQDYRTKPENEIGRNTHSTVEKHVFLAYYPGKFSLGISIQPGEKFSERDDVLTIRGAVSPVEDGKEASVYREFNWGDYFCQFTLAEVIDQGKIAAKMDNGILRLTLPKKEKVKPN
jgi:hypothetical protein